MTSGNPAHGKALFKMMTLPGGKPGCASCHTLAAAGTHGTIGPNLDDAFAADKAQGFSLTTMRDLVRGQIAYADSDPGTGKPGMPANLLTGQDARDVAVFIAQCAAEPHCKL